MSLTDKLKNKLPPKEQIEGDTPAGNNKVGGSSSMLGMSGSRIPAVDAVNGVNTAKAKNLKFVSINPDRCRPWRLHNRNQLWWLTPERCQGLIESIKREGQKQLGLVRRLHDDPDYDYEVIFGLRRWYSSKQAGVDFKAEITTLGDKECARLMLVENEYSEDISGLEKCFAMADQYGDVYHSLSELAQDYGVGRTIVHRNLKAAAIRKHEKVFQLIKPLLPGVSVRDAVVLAEFAENNSEQLRKNIAEHTPREMPSSAQTLEDQKEWCTIESKRLVKALTATDKKKAASRLEQKTAYIESKKGKGLVTLADNGKGKLTLTMDMKGLSGGGVSYDKQELVNQIANDLMEQLESLDKQD